MNLLLLGGQSINNKSWIEGIKELALGDYDKVEYVNYKHWQDGDKHIHIDYEIEKIAKLTSDWKSYVIFAKSMGIIVVLKALFEGRISPERCIFVGFPYSLAKELNLNVDNWIINVNVPTLLIQKEEDPYVSFNDVKAFIKNDNIEVKRYEGAGEPNNDHHYADIAYLRSEIIKFTK